ncbi:hypothetical protein FN846DRAFT_933329 [Sphaerosporella brunnea]|uniref:DUF1772-domain-containing protein n=1 Tax=Sphaerosporella brunnea TaxID=1250544 RepID=A0A5J5F6Z5_9PEZI|nr:hypothetical protein FN846DRAFT_933329 [Sphaerosporella brunnea]
MSTTPTANTLLHPAVRVAKLLGTVGASYAAGAYLTTSAHTFPSLTITSARDLALTLHNLRQRLCKPLLLLTTTSSTAFAYIAYYLYSTPVLTIPLASVAFTPGSFLPHAEATDVIVGSGWELYAVAAAALGAIIPWQVFGVNKVEKRIAAAGESVKAAEEKGLETAVVDRETVREDLEKWGKCWGVNGLLAASGALIGAYAAAWF